MRLVPLSLLFLSLASALLADPLVDVSTLIGGSGEDVIHDVALDDNGDVLVVGSTSSPDFPTVDGAPSGAGPDQDAFFLRLREVRDAQGNPVWQIVQSEVFGGDEDDEAQVVQPATEGVIIRGDARSADFPASAVVGAFPGRFTILIERESAVAASVHAPKTRRVFMESRRTELGDIGTNRTINNRPGNALIVSQSENGDVFVDDSNGGPLQEQMIASGAEGAVGGFSGTRLGDNPANGDFSFFLIQDMGGDACKLTRFEGRADGSLAPAGASTQILFEGSVDSFDIFTTTRDVGSATQPKIVPDKVYVFKKGRGSFAVAGEFDDPDFISIDFQQGGENVVAVCLDAQTLRPVRMGEQELQDVRDALIREGRDDKERLTVLGEALSDSRSGMLPELSLRRGAGLAEEKLGRVAQAAENTDIVVQFTDPDTLARLEAYRFGGDGNERPVTGVFNEAGDLFIAGTTDGALPLTPGALTAAPAGGTDGFLVKVVDREPPTLAAEAIVGAADFLGGPIAPGSILSAFAQGSGGLVTAELDDDDKFPTTLGGVRFLFDGDPGRMIFSTPGQSNVIAPFSVAGKTSVSIELEVEGLRSPPVQLDVAPAKPQIFSASQQGTGQAALLNQDFSVNGAANPGARGSVIQIFLTGGGQTDPPADNGGLAPTAEPLPRFADAQVLIGGVECQVLYAGAAPGLVHGVGQVNVIIDESIAAGDEVSLEVRIGGVSSQPGITIAVD